MIRFFLKERIADKEFREKRKIKLEEVSSVSGVSRNTLSRILNSYGYSTSTDVLDKLCVYFDCPLSELAEYVDG